ncbi:histidine kinase [Streptomyces sp. ZAF1911]|uniref:sensor histidine kinase n=1 Tax=Streptomyces sp. ZAF1911 TaxID=2944129 RepID=UPI00237C3720|nr:histidine kinase [Streptomyces sp. ZAF1911]MDD9376909.1 histidine kinase [Streptomyces sp. ZAF1911]
MSPRRAAPADRAPGTALPPSLGLDAAWAHPVLSRLLHTHRRLQRLDQRRPWLLDTAVVLLVVCVSLPDLLSGGHASPFRETDSRDQLPAAVPYVLSAALIVPLWWRRRAPGAVFFVIALVSLVQGILGLWMPAGLSALIALYTLARHGSLRVLGWAVAVAIAQVVLAAGVLVSVEHWLLGLFFLLGTVTAATASGLVFRIRSMYLTALEDRAKRLEVERDQRVRLTAAAERSRVAREMHDIVGHNLSVMVTLADGAATLATNRGEQSADALRILGDTGRQAMSELRRVLGVLREDQDDVRLLSPQPGIRDLDALLTRVRAAGLRVAYRTVGELDSLSSGVQLTVYRIVQESLTNTLKHAGTGASAEVTVTSDAGRVHVRVADTGPPPGVPVRALPVSDVDDPGNGLVGIRQRAALYGGTVTIGPRENRPGWIVDVALDVPRDTVSPTPGA